MRIYLTHDVFRIAGNIVILLAYALTGWAIAYHRIFDARQVLFTLTQRLALIAALGGGSFYGARLLSNFMPSPADLLVSILLCSSIAFWLDRKSREWLQLDGEELLGQWRRAVLEIARIEPQPAQLLTRFENLLRERCQTRFAALLVQHETSYRSGELEFRPTRPGHAVLCETGWATPENLQRRRPNPGIDDLRLFVGQHSLGLLVSTPRGTASPSFLIALGTKTTFWPFTYPEVKRVQSIAELMDNILTHSRLSNQAALQAKIEHLAMMSRGLAHDLKNLITPVASFLVHTDGHYAPESAEAEVHAAARRSIRVMSDYVREALFFSERLQPKLEPVELEKILAGVREVTAPRAASRGINVVTASGFPGTVIADAVLLQRLLANLVSNAIDASVSGQTVTVATNRGPEGWLRLQVTDAGRGIPANILSRIFDPYFTTKEFGDDVRGFGLGLTICQKITNLHRGKITVESELGEGTTVVVDLPTELPARGLLPTGPCLALP